MRTPGLFRRSLGKGIYLIDVFWSAIRFKWCSAAFWYGFWMTSLLIQRRRSMYSTCFPGLGCMVSVQSHRYCSLL